MCSFTADDCFEMEPFRIFCSAISSSIVKRVERKFWMLLRTVLLSCKDYNNDQFNMDVHSGCLCSFSSGYELPIRERRIIVQPSRGYFDQGETSGLSGDN